MRILPALLSLRLSHRLALAFATVIALLLVVAGLGLRHVDTLATELRETVEVRGARVDAANAMASHVHEATQSVLALMQADSPEEQAIELKALEAAQARYAQARQRLAQSATDAAQALAAVDETAQAAGVPMASLRDIARRGGDLRSAAVSLDPREPQLRWLRAVAQLVEHERGASARAYEAARREAASARRVLVAVALAAVVAAALAGRAILRSVRQPVAEALVQARAIASGDLAARMTLQRRGDEMGELLDGLGSMRDGLRALVGDVQVAVGEIGIASGEIANGHADLATRSTLVSARLKDAVLEASDVVAAGERIGRLAGEAASLAGRATEQATLGGALFERVVATMRGIDEEARQVSEIVGVIDAIAMQTNILALNASVEAARAGESGRGFAVVADQVRDLARRSADSARQIKGLIGEAVRRIGEGVQEVGAAESSMRDIVGGTLRVAEVVAGTTDALREQRQGLQAVSAALSELQDATQQNAALVEQGAAATATLNGQAAALALSISRFRLGVA